MKLTIDMETLIAKIKARQAREQDLRARGIAILRDWLKRRPARKSSTS